MSTHAEVRLDLQKILDLMHMFGFPIKLSKKISLDKLKALMSLDKKSISNETRFVILEGIGATDSCSGAFCRGVNSSVIPEAFDWMSSL